MEKEILNLFLYNEKMKFSDIEKSLDERSNKIAYHLKNLIKKKILSKEGESYKLTKKNLIPYLSVKKHMLPTVIIHLGNERECFMVERNKMPFKGLLGMPGGRILLGENINDCIKRIMKERHGIYARLKKINSVSIEHIKDNNEIIQSDLVIFVTIVTEKRIPLKNIEENKSKMIKSDYKLLKKHLSKNMEIEKFLTAN